MIRKSMRTNEEALVELGAYLTGHWLTDFANFSAFVFDRIPDLNWAGFYLDDGKVLRLGPFVGKPACTEIRYDRGVCGAAFSRREALIVPDVHQFPGHIACDSASRSEMVLPILFRGEVWGVFDLDSPLLARFTEENQSVLERWLSELVSRVGPRLSGRPWAQQ